MTPARSHTATAAPPTGRTASSGLWLHLSPTLAGAGILDGGWCLAGLESTLGPITKVAINLDAWDRAHGALP
jgi:hypothetical protein